MSTLAVKPKASAKKKPRGKPFTGKDDPRNGPGAPKRGGSMAEAYEWVLSMSPDTVADVLEINGKSDLSRQFRQMPRGIQNQILLAMRVFAAAMFEPQAAMLNHIIDRVDGPVKIPIETWQDRVIALLKEKKVTVEQVADEFGADTATTLAIAAGLQLGESSEAGTISGDTNQVAD